MFLRKTPKMVSPEEALPGRTATMPVPEKHLVLGTPLTGPFPAHMKRATFAMGCFWGAEKFMWKVPGVYTTFVGYAGGYTPNPTYEEVCSERTGHAEVAVVIYDPAVASYDDFLKVFWENHDPTTPNRQGGDIGTQYRSAIYVHDTEQEAQALASKERYQAALHKAGFKDISTEIAQAGPFYYAEPYHQQYLQRVPNGYCNHGFCQVGYPGGVEARANA
jgi:peptide-methionine (S)-S-oxide reductase